MKTEIKHYIYLTIRSQMQIKEGILIESSKDSNFLNRSVSPMSNLNFQMNFQIVKLLVLGAQWMSLLSERDAGK